MTSHAAKPSFKLIRPARQETSVVFASPHSGQFYPESFQKAAVLDALTLRSSEDAFVGDLFAAAPEYGAPLLLACYPRAYVDLNRAATELDPAVIAGLRRGGTSPRVASGLGVIPRVVANGRCIYRGKITMAEAQTRLANVWRPFHGQLSELVNETQSAFGEAILIDCHSMPHDAALQSRRGGVIPHVILGDRFGGSASGWVTDAIEAAFTDEGLTVHRNAPFAGAYTAQHYGRPAERRHAVQVEIDRALYMDEASITPNAEFETFRALIARVTAKLVQIGQDRRRLAAE